MENINARIVKLCDRLLFAEELLSAASVAIRTSQGKLEWLELYREYSKLYMTTKEAIRKAYESATDS